MMRTSWAMGQGRAFRLMAVALLATLLLAEQFPLSGTLLPRRQAVRIGHVERFVDAGGRELLVKTLSVAPPVFEVEQFFTPEECAAVVRVSRETQGVMNDSGQRWRASQHGWVRLRGATGKRLQARASALTALPPAVLRDSEPMQVVRYGPGGHYHAHHDSTPPHTARFATLLVYLSNTKGGETAFPLALGADTCNDESCDGKHGVTTATEMNFAAESSFNLSTKAACEAGLAVRPALGKAILFYNHLAANATHLGSVDDLALHGGCDVAPGAPDKWIANLWFNVPGEEALLAAKRAAADANGESAKVLLASELEAAFENMHKLTYEEQLVFAQQLREQLDRDDSGAK